MNFIQSAIGLIGLISSFIWLVSVLTKIFGFHDATIAPAFWWALGCLVANWLITLFRKMAKVDYDPYGLNARKDDDYWGKF